MSNNAESDAKATDHREASFTKGPWAVRPFANGEFYPVRVTSNHGGNSVAAIDNQSFGTNSRLGWDREKQQANAHLIAAAPEMFEALEGLCRIVETLGPRPDTYEAYRQGKDALAKARGETTSPETKGLANE